MSTPVPPSVTAGPTQNGPVTTPLTQQLFMGAPMLANIYQPGVQLGCDPEVFIRNTKTGRIVGSERVFQGGLRVKDSLGNVVGRTDLVVNDGVQVEIHPDSSTCRQSLSYSIQGCLRLLMQELQNHPDLKVDFSSVITMKRADLEGLSEHARVLGCAPSFNAYGKPHVEVNGLKYLKRSAAGHIHMGTQYVINPNQADKTYQVIEPNVLANALDISTGLISVLVDRDPKAHIRRKVYGRAGEYRLPVHGFEYRTLSNFWLRCFKTQHFVMGQARVGMALAYTKFMKRNQWTIGSGYWHECLDELIAKMPLKKVEKAINNNDRDLAFKLYDTGYKPIMKLVANRDGIYTMNGSDPDQSQSWNDFEYFISKPLEHWFPQDPADYWYSGHGISQGFENFLWQTVRPQRQQHELATKNLFSAAQVREVREGRADVCTSNSSKVTEQPSTPVSSGVEMASSSM